MKTKIGMLLIALCMSFVTFAQSKPDDKGKEKQTFTPEQIAQKRTDAIKTRLQLTDAQAAKIYELNLKQVKEQIAEKDKEKAEREKKIEQRKAQEAEFLSILTPSQKAAYDQWKQDRKKDMKKGDKHKRPHSGKDSPKRDK